MDNNWLLINAKSSNPPVSKATNATLGERRETLDGRISLSARARHF